MDVHDLGAILKDLPTLDITESTIEHEGMAAHRMLGRCGRHTLGLVRFAGQTPWERHPEDELLHVLEGEVELTLLADDGPVHRTLRAGSVFVVPREHWHRQLPRPVVTLFFGTVVEGTTHSDADDPRRAP